MQWTRCVVVALAGVAVSLTGCALFSEARHQQGEALTAAWSQVDLAAQIETPRSNLAALLDEQLKVEDQLWRFARNRVAELMLTGWTVRDMRRHVATRMAQMAGDEVNAVALAGAAADEATARMQLAGRQQSMAIAGVEWPGCDVALDETKRRTFLASLQDAARAVVEASLTTAKDPCTKLAALDGLRRKGGELATAQQALERERAGLQADINALSAARAEFDAAQAEYKTAADALAATPGSGRDALDRADQKLRKAIDTLVRLESALGRAFVSQERLNALNRFLTTYEDVVAGKGAPEGSNRAAIALAIFPDLREKARAALLEADKPNLLPLVMQKKVEQARLEAAQRNVARRQQLLQLRQAVVDQIVERLDAYDTVVKALDGSVLSARMDQRMGPLLVPVKTSPLEPRASGRSRQEQERAQAEQNAALAEQSAKLELWRSAAILLDAESRLRANIGKTRYQITALVHEEAISLAESGVMQWKGLIDPSVELLAAYGASGIKASDIRDFVNLLSLLWIAVGVN